MQHPEQADTGVLTSLFRHNTWANLELLEFCEGLNEEQLDATAIGCFGSIRNTLTHIIGAEVDYVHLVNDKLPPVPPSRDQFMGFEALKDAVRWAGDELLQLALSARAGTIVRWARTKGTYEFTLTGLMVKVINHSTEHRTQISAIITQLGMEPPALTGWKYLREVGEMRELAC